MLRRDRLDLARRAYKDRLYDAGGGRFANTSQRRLVARMRHDGHGSGHQLGGRRNQALIFHMGLGFSLVVDRNDAHCSAPNCFGEGYDALALSALGTKGRLSAPASEGAASSSTSKS